MADATPPRSYTLRKPPHRERLESPFCLSHCATPNAVSLGFPGLAHCPSLVQSQVQPSRVSVCRFNRAPVTVRFCIDRCGAPLRSGAGRSRTGCRLHQPRPLPGVPHLFYTWEFPCSVGTKIRLEMLPRLTLSAHPARASILGCSHSAILSPPPTYVTFSI